MKRSNVSIDAVADWHNLAAAFHLAQRGKQGKSEVQQFALMLTDNLAALRNSLLQGTFRPGAFSSFHILDPKPRVIHAPCFRDRVLHHALMLQAGPVFDRSLVYDTYACRTGKGSLAAVKRCEQHLHRYDWFAKIDMSGYFASIDHQVLKRLIRQRFKNQGLLRLFDLIIGGFETGSGKGLPIGALSSQYFANYYLSPVDRFLLENCKVEGMVRYMDDIVWFDRDKALIKNTLNRIVEITSGQLALQIKPTVQINRSNAGVTFCGYRVTRQGLKLTVRRRKLYAVCRARWESAFAAGEITASQLQNGYASALGMTVHAHSAGWRKKQLVLNPMPLEVVCL